MMAFFKNLFNRALPGLISLGTNLFILVVGCGIGLPISIFYGDEVRSLMSFLYALFFR